VVWVHFESVCILAGVIFCLDIGLRGLRLVSVVVERAFCDVLVDVFLRFLFFSRDFFGCTWVAGTRFGVDVVCVSCSLVWCLKFGVLLFARVFC
jgi:hypothetical protein